MGSSRMQADCVMQHNRSQPSHLFRGLGPSSSSAPVEMESKMPSTSSVVCAFWLKLSRTAMPGRGWL